MRRGIDSTAGEYTGARSQVRDPGGETILEIREALGQINPAAAAEFIRLYLEMPKNEG
jgi:phosphoribosylformylglycinamidine (FGAM) synthase PurS component